MRFVIPLPPNRGNARGGWRKHHRAKCDYWESLDTIQLLKKRDSFEVPPPPELQIGKATLTAMLYVWNFYDDDGAMALCKWPIDWLVTRGYLLNDSRKYLRWASVPDQQIDRQNPRLELTLEAK